MKVPKVFYHLEYFTKDDFHKFDKFLKSPYFNNFKAYSDILSIIIKNKSLLPTKNYLEIKKRIIASLSCSESTTRKLLSKFGDLIIEYLKVKTTLKNQFASEYLLCEEILTLGYYDLINKKLNSCRDYLDKGNKIDENTYFDYFKLNYLNYKTITLLDSKLTGDNGIVLQQKYTRESSKDLFVFTMVRLTFNYINYLIQNIDSGYKSSLPFPINIRAMFDIIKTKEFNMFDDQQKAIIELYYKLFIMFSNLNDDNAYKLYKDYFYKVKSIFNADFSKTHFNVLFNYCNLRKRLDDNEQIFRKEGIELLLEYIAQKMYMDEKNKHLNPILYRNIVVSSYLSKDILKSFIDKQTIYLHPSHFNDMLNFGNAHLYYMKKEYGKALKCVIALRNPKFMYKYDIRNLELKIYYEKNNIDALLSVLHNYYQNIKNEPIFTRNDKKRYFLQVYYLKKLLKANEKYEFNKKIIIYEYLMNEITKKPNFVMKKWILDKINIVIQKHCSINKINA